MNFFVIFNEFSSRQKMLGAMMVGFGVILLAGGALCIAFLAFVSGGVSIVCGLALFAAGIKCLVGGSRISRENKLSHQLSSFSNIFHSNDSSEKQEHSSNLSQSLASEDSVSHDLPSHSLS